jgi:hypothetical protein
MADQKAPVLTEAIKSYDGIFKGMYDSNLRQQFLRVRELHIACVRKVILYVTF